MEDFNEIVSDKSEGLVFSYFAMAVLRLLYFGLSFSQAVNFFIYKLAHVVTFFFSAGNTRSLKGLPKRPAHLAMVIADPPVRFTDLSKILAWCHEAGIYYVTLYDFDGLIKSAPNQLLEAAGPLARGKFKIELHFFSHERHNEMASRNNVSGVLHVHLAASEDGRGALVEAARTLHRTRATGVTISNLDRLLRGKFHHGLRTDWPEPDLLIRCGGVHSHLGFLPWALRLTEFADLYSHKYLLPSEFQDLLWKFAKIDRRFGR
ncbi:nogo-B receptor-like [Tropilaelaps mercedesae]|uniref:ditrans,polycis-polyprenyl diphosphate synthase [(2E,6E)-farnesyldiphosphate specific] n=1 Tax=Tropilaelaps mercedesae TaxID=418985 RepID=A0A1V9XDN2_9ACAR|nr:nogo-B receptor-like [Tropilaelaps mercedesae]